jgi:hypothetical protein
MVFCGVAAARNLSNIESWGWKIYFSFFVLIDCILRVVVCVIQKISTIRII